MITPQVVAKALPLGDVLSIDDRVAKEWIKDYPSEAEVRALGEALCCPKKAVWQGKKDKFQATLSCAGLKYPHKAC